MSIKKKKKYNFEIYFRDLVKQSNIIIFIIIIFFILF